MTEGGNANYRIEVISADLAKDTSFLPYAYRRTERFSATTEYFSKMFEESSFQLLNNKRSRPGGGAYCTRNKNKIAMKTFILFWNPAISSYKLESFREFIKDQPFEYEFNWSIWDHQLAHEGDRFFMIRCKNKPVPGKLNKWGKQEWEPAIDDTTGICMAGHFSSDPYRGEDWSGKGRETYYMDMELTEAADPDKNIIVKTADLMAAIPDFDWKGGHSGRLLDEAAAEKLEALYKKALDANTGDLWAPATDVFID